MSIDPTSALRRAIITALEANGGPRFTRAGQNIAVPAFDRVPDNREPPAVILDTVDLGPATTKDNACRDVTFTVVTVHWSRSKIEAEAIMASVFERLDDVPLAPAGIGVTNPKLQSSTLEQIAGADPAFAGRQTFRLMTL